MLTLITGTPGSGKSLYGVSNLIPAYLKQTVKLDDGQEVPRRILVDGIKDLILPHETLAPCKVSWDEKAELSCEGEGVANWWEWCKPGDVIVIDEVQRYWRPRGNGTKVPRMIAELETHRHRGVDFILITQHPMLLDQNVRRLVSQHIHMRRMWGGNRAVRYEWDHCSNPEAVGLAGKSYWPYPKDAFKYYRSAEVHTRQGGRPPAALLILALAIFAAPVIGYVAISRSHAMLSQPVQPARVVAEKLKDAPPSPAAVPATARAGVPALAGAGLAAVLPAKPMIAGCISSPTRCACFDDEGALMTMEPAQCQDEVQHVRRLLASSAGPSSRALPSPPAGAASRAGVSGS